MASAAATSANCANLSSSTKLFSSKCSAASKPQTCAPLGNRNGSNPVIGRIPERPVDIASQNGPIPHPRAETAPIPVTTTLAAGKQTLHTSSYISDAGHTYATALYLSGLDPDALRSAGKGRNVRPAMKFNKKP